MEPLRVDTVLHACSWVFLEIKQAIFADSQSHRLYPAWRASDELGNPAVNRFRPLVPAEAAPSLAGPGTLDGMAYSPVTGTNGKPDQGERDERIA
jgi:hypothetical protein